MAGESGTHNNKEQASRDPNPKRKAQAAQQAAAGADAPARPGPGEGARYTAHSQRAPQRTTATARTVGTQGRQRGVPGAARSSS